MTTTKKQPTNPFVYVIAAAVIAILSLWLRFLIDALDSHNQAIESVTEVTDYLNRGAINADTDDVSTATGSTPASDTGATATGNASAPTGAVQQ